MKEPFAHLRPGAWMLCLLLLTGVVHRSLAAEEGAPQNAAPTLAAADTNAAPAASATAATRAEAPGTAPSPAGSPDEIQLSLQGANVDMVVQWLAQNTGKTVIKHP